MTPTHAPGSTPGSTPFARTSHLHVHTDAPAQGKTTAVRRLCDRLGLFPAPAPGSTPGSAGPVVRIGQGEYAREITEADLLRGGKR